MATPARRDAGFTLIEVLVALAILSIALLGIIGAVSAYVDSTSGMRARLSAHWAALNAVEAARLDPATAADGHSEEEIGGFTWKVEVAVEPTELDSTVQVTAHAVAKSGTGVGGLAVAYVEVPASE